MLRPFILTLGAAGAIVACACYPKASSRVSGEESSNSDRISIASKPVEYEALQRVNVTRLYEDNCGKCHGMRGEGGGAGTKTLLTQEKFDQKLDKPFFDAIKLGVKDMGMEAYGETMSEPEIWALVVHIRELQAAALRRETGSSRAQDGVYKTKLHNYKIQTIVDSGLRTPWAVDWLPDGSMLITNRPGYMNVYAKGVLSEPVSNMPPCVEIGQGGLMDVAVHPNYDKNGWIYLAVNDPAKSGRGGMTKIVRGKLKYDGIQPSWTDQQTIFELDQAFYNGSGVHFGCKIVFDGKGKIYFAIGERGSGDLAQDLSRPNGKVYRLNEDGTVPSDNPFVGKSIEGKKVIEAIWSYGHRNPQGLVLGHDGVLWDTEHGPRGGDELNVIEKGANYGWPLVAFSINYNDSPYRTPWPSAEQKFKMPEFRWLPSIGACGLDVHNGRGFSKWSGNLLAGGLSGANVDRIVVKGGKFIEREEILHGMGRVRDVVCSKNGDVYVVLNGPDKVIRLVPSN